MSSTKLLLVILITFTLSPAYSSESSRLAAVDNDESSINGFTKEQTTQHRDATFPVPTWLEDFERKYESKLLQFNQQVMISLELRKQSTEFFKQELQEGKSQYFDAQDIEKIHTAVNAYMKNRNILLNDIAYSYRDDILDSELVLTSDMPTGRVWNKKGKASRVSKLYINPYDQKGRLYISMIKLGLASALVLYDNFIIAIMPYQEKGHFRREINYDNVDNAKIIETISANFRKLDNYKDTLSVIEFYDQVQKWEKQNTSSELVKSEDNAYLNLLIDGSYTKNRIKDIGLRDRLSFRTVRFRRILRDTLFDVGSETMNSASKAFGNTVGLIAFREGYLKNISSEQKTKIDTKLMPGDILLEKTPFRLTDRFIPGHWGHVAIWMGSKEQLIELGVWDELPDLYAKSQKRFNYKGPSFQSQISKGQKIVEALRDGVQINTLDHFLNIDDLAVLRDEAIFSDRDKLKEYLLKAFEQIGKDYDFNFDVETDTKIVCSELAFVVYKDYEWSVDKALGRYTISPDHVANKARGDGEFKPIMLYHQGHAVENNIQSTFNQLLDDDFESAQAEM